MLTGSILPVCLAMGPTTTPTLMGAPTTITEMVAQPTLLVEREGTNEGVH